MDYNGVCVLPSTDEKNPKPIHCAVFLLQYRSKALNLANIILSSLFSKFIEQDRMVSSSYSRWLLPWPCNLSLWAPKAAHKSLFGMSTKFLRYCVLFLKPVCAISPGWRLNAQ